jgi:hypothetical protein
MKLLQQGPYRSLPRSPATGTALRWKGGVLPAWKRFLRALLRGLAVGAA